MPCSTAITVYGIAERCLHLAVQALRLIVVKLGLRRSLTLLSGLMTMSSSDTMEDTACRGHTTPLGEVVGPCSHSPTKCHRYSLSGGTPTGGKPCLRAPSPEPSKPLAPPGPAIAHRSATSTGPTESGNSRSSATIFDYWSGPRSLAGVLELTRTEADIQATEVIIGGQGKVTGLVAGQQVTVSGKAQMRCAPRRSSWNRPPRWKVGFIIMLFAIEQGACLRGAQSPRRKRGGPRRGYRSKGRRGKVRVRVSPERRLPAGTSPDARVSATSPRPGALSSWPGQHYVGAASPRARCPVERSIFVVAIPRGPPRDFPRSCRASHLQLGPGL